MSDRNTQRSDDSAALTRNLHNLSPTANPHHLHDTDIELDPLRNGSNPPPHINMSSSTDAVFVSDVDIEQDLKEREGRVGNGSTGQLQSVSPTPEVDEEAPLLSDTGSSYGGRESLDNHGKNREPEWHGHAELRGLPWRKRPSVCNFSQTEIIALTLDRYTGSCHHFSFSHWQLAPL
jgi:hypothetical protein